MKKVIVVILLFVCHTSVFAEDGWIQQASGITSNINSVYFFSPASGLAAGNNSNLIQTSDGGSTWSPVSISSSSNFQKIHFRSSTDGYLLTQDGNLYASSDAGVSWTVMSLGSYGLNGMSFSGSDGIIVGDNGNVYTSPNGSTWTKQSPLGVFTVNDVVFLNDTLVVAVGAGGEIHKSIDKGFTWTSVNSAVTNTLSAIDKLNDSTLIVIGTGGTILEFKPLTESILPVAVGLSSDWLKDVSCDQQNTCRAVGTGNTFLIRSNGAWIARNMDDNVNLNAVHFVTGSIGYVVGIAGVIYRHDAAGFPNSISSIKNTKLKIYPVPVQEILTIELPSNGTYNLVISNSLGFKISSSTVQGEITSINTRNLSPGLYFVHLSKGSQTTSSKFLKK
jgi:photosystem II stability/assembly factor-like uncharacterized protein